MHTLKLKLFFFIRPAPSYYFPTLHQLKFEVEDGTTPNSRPVRFGYNPQEFPDFSWRGYAIMSPAQVCPLTVRSLMYKWDVFQARKGLSQWPCVFSLSPLWDHHESFAFASAQIIFLEAHSLLSFQCCCGNVNTSSLRTNTLCLQPEVILMLSLGFPGPFHIVIRYSTPQHKGKARVRAWILVVDKADFHSCCDCKWRAFLALALFYFLHLACYPVINLLSSLNFPTWHDFPC